jgi:hypothetical protein
VALLLVGVLNTKAQEPPTSGTLTLVFTNRNGFVIASDSRRSSANGRFLCNGVLTFFCDDSQKVFKTGPRSALAISGFASSAFGTPLDLHVASVLRKRYRYVQTPSAEAAPPKGSHPMMTSGPLFFGAYKNRSSKRPPGGEDYELEQALTAVAALVPDASQNALGFTTLIADFDKQGYPNIQRIDYVNNAHPAGPLGIVMPDYDAEDVTTEQCRSIKEEVAKTELNDVPFRYCFAGIDETARKIMSGEYRSQRPAIRRYYHRLKLRSLNTMSLREMKELAHSILAETNNRAAVNARQGELQQTISLVGGTDQIGLFPRKGTSQCCGQSDLPHDEQLLPLKFVRAGFRYDGSSEAVPVNPIGISMFWGGQHSPGERIGQVFVGNLFRNVIVRLDGNYFVKNQFESVTFSYEGGECFLPAELNDVRDDCTLALIGTGIPQSCQIVSYCKPQSQPIAQRDEALVVGSPVQMKFTGCTRMNSDGTITIYAGGECGDVGGISGPPIK